MPELQRDAPSLHAPDFSSYEDYLDSHVNAADLFYLDDMALARQLIEFGYHARGDVLPREDFEAHKQAAEEAAAARLSRKPRRLASAGKSFPNCLLLQALADREDAVRNGKLATIVFIRDTNAQNQEVSGYIDYGSRLQQEGAMEAVFGGDARLIPKGSDLSYYNWNTRKASGMDSDQFEVQADSDEGLMFKSKWDRKTISVNPAGVQGDNSTRIEIASPHYKQAVLYDHVLRCRG
eukprot:jgi/Botrbrau1/7074/Bobra.0165s0096.1